MGRSTFNTHAQQDETMQIVNTMQQSDRVVMLCGEICEQTVYPAIMQLTSLANQSNDTIHLLLTTYGGDITDMFGIIDVMKMIRAPVCTVGIGKIMSAGVCILAAGEKGMRMCGRNARIMVHSVSGGTHGNVWDVENEAKEMQYSQRQMVMSLVENTKITQKQLEEIMLKKTDTYFSASEALQFGIIDKVVG